MSKEYIYQITTEGYIAMDEYYTTKEKAEERWNTIPKEFLDSHSVLLYEIELNRAENIDCGCSNCSSERKKR